MSVTVELPAEWGRDYLLKMISNYINQIYSPVLSEVAEENKITVLPDRVKIWLDTICIGKYEVLLCRADLDEFHTQIVFSEKEDAMQFIMTWL